MKCWIASVATVGLIAGSSWAAGGTTYSDATGDLFDNGFTNLDIFHVTVTNDEFNVHFTVTTSGFQSWTKYLFFFNTGSESTISNPWNRPIDIGSANPGGINRFIGSWVDQPSGNSQQWAFNGTDWNLDATGDNDQSMIGSNKVTWSVSMAWLGVEIGETFWFDVATSGGGNDPGVDHLSRPDPATTGWGDPSVAGAFLAYTVVPTPGAVALLAAAGLARSRRRG